MKTQRRKAGTAIKKMPLTNAAYAALKDKILKGAFAPGQYLNENEIADKLKIGRTPVHQALQRLHIEGLVKVVPRKGVIIQHDSVQQMLDVLSARILIEPALVQQAVGNATDSDIEQLERTLLRNARSASITFFIDKDRTFHSQLATLAGNKMLADFVGMLHERFIRYLTLQMWHTNEAAVRADQDHKAIVDAMRERDATAAAKAMRRHLTGLKARLEALPMAANAS